MPKNCIGARSMGQSRGDIHQGAAENVPSVTDRLSKRSKFTSLESDSKNPAISCFERDRSGYPSREQQRECSLTGPKTHSISPDCENKNGARFDEVFAVNDGDLEDLLDFL